MQYPEKLPAFIPAYLNISAIAKFFPPVYLIQPRIITALGKPLCARGYCNAAYSYC
jgi:hypothetical protein